MEFSGLQCSTSNSITSNGKRKAEASTISTMVPSKKAKLFATYQSQGFSLSDSMMFYIAKNPTSPELYNKMVQTCKYFFVKNPVIVTSLYFFLGEWKFSFNEHPIDFSKISSKLWIIDRLYITYIYPETSANKKAESQNILSSVMSKLYKCDAKCVTIDSQIISCRDLSIFISSAESISFSNSTLKDESGSTVAVEKFVGVAVKARKIQILSSTGLLNITSETMKELLKIPHFSKLDDFSLTGIPEAFDLETFYSYMKQNQTTTFILRFDGSISDAYKNRIEEIIDEILATETRDYKPPCIRFPGLDITKSFELQKLSISFFFL